MEPTSELLHIIQETVLEPSISSAFIIFWFSLVNELFAVLPYVAVISGQILFLHSELSIKMLSQLMLLIAIPAGVGGALGSMLTYGVTYIGGKPAINKLGRYVRLSWEDVEKATLRFKGGWYDELLFLALRSIPVLPSLPVNVAAGVVRMHPLTYFLLTFVAFTIRMMIMFIFLGASAEVLSY